MAHREYVTRDMKGVLGAASLAVLFGTVCSQAGPPDTEFRGRVIDQDTNRPIAGAIVVGKYIGSRGPEGSTSCNRVESAVSDHEGWFTLPLDAKDGGPLMEAYQRGYKWGRSPRKALRGVDGNVDHWQVQIVEWNADISKARLVRYEPTIYRSQAEALAASRQELDVYLKPFSGTREERLRELHRLPIAGSCGGTYYTTVGPIPFFEAIQNEQIQLGDDEPALNLISGAIAAARLQHERIKPHK